MTALVPGSIPVEVDAEGFLTDPGLWTEDMAPALARREGIDPLTAAHWSLIRVVRRQYHETGAAPNVRALSKIAGVSVKDLYRLFPKGPAKTAAKLAGVPKPRGCI